MTQSDPLEKLASTGLLKREPPGREEIAGLLRTAAVRLEDARNAALAPESRFDLAYNAAHALALAALRIHGFRTDKRYIVFQALPHTLGVDAPIWRLLDRCHRGTEFVRVRRGRLGRREARRRSHRRSAPSSPASSRARGSSGIFGVKLDTHWIRGSDGLDHCADAQRHYASYKGRTLQAYFASSNGGQEVVVIPELDTVVATYGGNYSDRAGWLMVRELLPKFILAAVAADKEGKR